MRYRLLEAAVAVLTGAPDTLPVGALDVAVEASSAAEVCALSRDKAAWTKTIERSGVGLERDIRQAADKGGVGVEPAGDAKPTDAPGRSKSPIRVA